MPTPRDHSWAYALKPGNKAAVRERPGCYSPPYALATFSRATATQFIFDEGTRIERRVNKSDLRIRGANHARIEPCTPEVLEHNERWGMVRDMICMRDENWKALSTDTLRNIHALVSPVKAPS